MVLRARELKIYSIKNHTFQISYKAMTLDRIQVLGGLNDISNKTNTSLLTASFASSICFNALAFFKLKFFDSFL